MPDGGTLSIAVSAARVDEGETSELKPGRYIRVAVGDTGSGMDEATLARAIEPFFSTKGVGRGTGLGLSMVHGLVAQLGGGLSVSSKPGYGTRVELHLPTSDETAHEDEASEAEDAETAAGTVLLVDDEILIRMSTADMLVDLGYDVIDAGSAEEALQLVEEGQHFDILVTDHLMPGLSGLELAEILRRRRPGLRVLLASGHADIEGVPLDVSRLVKPFRQDDLAVKLREIHGA